MAFQTRDLWARAGIAIDDTLLAAQGYAIRTDKMRLHLGRWQTMGGWEARITGIVDPARGLFSWASNNGTPYVAIGTASKLYAHSGAELYDITPVRDDGAVPVDAFETTDLSSVVTVNWTAHGFVTGDTIYLTGVSTFNGVTIGGATGTLPADPFIVSSGSNQVIVTDTAHGLADNDYVNFAGVVPINGIDPNGTWRVQVLTADSYKLYATTDASSSGVGGGAACDYRYYKAYIVTISTVDIFMIDVAPQVANATGSGGGATATFIAEINVGPVFGAASVAGYGTGPYGMGPYGTSTLTTDSPVLPRTWSMQQWGEFLIANPFGGGIYQWELNPSIPAAVVMNAPAQCNIVLVTGERFLLACGCTSLAGDYDQMLVRNSSDQDNTIWTPAATNNAGDFRLAVGSQIVGALNTQNGAVILTDVAPYAVNYVGVFEQIYSASLIATNAGLIGPNAVVDMNGDVYWMSPGLEFYRYSGGKPVPIECPVKRWLGERLAQYQNFCVFAFVDAKYLSVSWLFASTDPDPDNQECSEYIRVDLRESAADPRGGWANGTFDRSAWIAASIFDYPLAVSPGGTLYEQEKGLSADGASIERLVEFAPVQLDPGNKVQNINRIVLDADIDSGTTIEMSLLARRWPNGPLVTKGPYLCDSTTLYNRCRAQGRQVGLLISSDGTADRWRLGTIRMDIEEGAER